MQFMDYHVHSDYSDDSWYLMEDVVQDAIKIGLSEICFTEHVDYGVKEDWLPDDNYLVGKNKVVKNVHYPRYFKEIAELKQRYQNQITIKTGMEFGMQQHTIAPFQTLFDAHPFDFILLSVHQIDNLEFWTGEFQKGRTQQESYQRYYEEMYELVTLYKDYSVLAHMDLIRRYLDKETDAFDTTKEQIAEILKVVIQDGKGIELNTSSHRYGIHGYTPSIDILTLYRDLGGQIITIGSDSHEPAHLGFQIKEGQALLQSLGFAGLYTFDQMTPILHSFA
ncbi:histidinol-phosphatase HisJ family protein [Enterococcus sp. N342-3-1-2]